MLRFEVSGQTLASFRDAVAKLRRDAGEHLNDDAMLLLLARHVLGGPTDAGRASYQVAIDICENCRRARQLADGERIGVSPAVAEMACCDAQWLPSAHMGGDESNGARADDVVAITRATQDVAPAVRRAVLRRDCHRCQVPGCAHAGWVDAHHIETRADGGGHDAGNLLTLCGAHHTALHDGRLILLGSIDTGLEFRHADGTLYGLPPSAPAANAQAQAFRALRSLGFSERDARRALAESLALSSNLDLQALLRQCLERLTARSLLRAS